MKNKKKVLITGAAGFLGSHLCDKFIKEGYHVIGMDNFITGDKKNIEHLENNPNFSFMEHDVTEYIDVEGDVDYILHFASPASPIDYLKIPIQTLKVGSLGTHNLLGLAKAKKARILIASTSEVYRDPLVHPQTEDYWGNVNCTGIRSCYDEGKRVAETLTFDYHRQYGVEVRVARIFNTHGTRMLENDGRVVSNFIVQALKGIPLTIYGDGSQTRSFSYVSDTVAGIIAMMESNHYEVFNIGNPYEMTVKELAETILKLTNSKSEIIYKPLPNDDPQQRRPDISKAKEKLNWEPKVDLETGLNTTIEWIKKELSK